MAKNILTPSREIYILGSASVVGRKEYEGPIGQVFDCFSDGDDKFGTDTWEKAESEMQRLALTKAIGKSRLQDNDIDLLCAGDLLNQCVGSNYGLVDFDIPYIGLYGACSTAAEGMIVSSLFCSSAAKRCAAVSSSHNCAAERQFRFPLEYGGQRTPTSQWTVTGAGAFIITSDANDFEKQNTHPKFLPQIVEVMPGCVIDYGINDINNMGAAMAPAAADTIYRYLKASGSAPEDFDLILTGDLGIEGITMLRDLLEEKNCKMGDNLNDCGLLIYDAKKQDVHAGGSGCGCSAVVMASFILDKIRTGELRNVLFIGTGALMSPLTLQQGGTIPGIGHLVHLRAARPWN